MFLTDFVRFIHIYPCVYVNIVTDCACPYTTKMFELVQDTHMVWMCACVCMNNYLALCASVMEPYGGVSVCDVER